MLKKTSLQFTVTSLLTGWRLRRTQVWTILPAEVFVTSMAFLHTANGASWSCRGLPTRH